MNQFEKMGIDEDFNPFYTEFSIKKPTDVQAKTVPKILGGSSVLCVAQTGTGKTLTYALPLSELVKRDEDENGISRKKGKPQLIVVAPTKELAVQIHGVFKSLSHHVKLRVRTLIAGGSHKSQANLKSSSFEILVGTPTRLARAIKNKEIGMDCVRHLVFDEADQLFDMGFKKDMETILFPLSYDTTGIHFFSATLPLEIEDFLGEKFQKKKLEKILLHTAHTVQQRVETFNIFLSPKEKMRMLKLFIEKTAHGRGIVFINQKNQVKDVCEFIDREMPKLRYTSLHGELSQKERINNYKSFSAGKSQILFATDVAARGIDIKDVSWVLNYGLPKTAIYYLHRCGRTGRAGRSGAVYNFVTSFDTRLIGLINESIKRQSSLDIALIAKDMKEVKQKKKAKVKTKSKRVKITKRSGKVR